MSESNTVALWKLRNSNIRAYLDLAAKLAEEPSIFSLIGKEVADSTGKWFAIRDKPGDTSEQCKLRMQDLLNAGQLKTLSQLHDILLPHDKNLAEYVSNIKV